jgi:hypothetical protein
MTCFRGAVAFVIVLFTIIPCRADFIITGAAWSPDGSAKSILWSGRQDLGGTPFAWLSNAYTGAVFDPYQQPIPIHFWFTFSGTPPVGMFPTVDAPIEASLVLGFYTNSAQVNDGGIRQPLNFGGEILISTRGYDMSTGTANLLTVHALPEVGSTLAGASLLGQPLGTTATLEVTGALGAITEFSSPLPGFTDRRAGLSRRHS